MMPYAVPLQLGEVSSMLCDYGIGQLFTFILTILAVALLYLGIVQAVAGLNDYFSPKQQEQREGREKVEKGAKKALAGIFAPTFVAFFLDYIGVSTISCFTVDIGLI